MWQNTIYDSKYKKRRYASAFNNAEMVCIQIYSICI